MLRKHRLLTALLLTATLALGLYLTCRISGCTATPEGFRTTASPAHPADLMAGPWTGTWSSDSKPLHGRLTAVIDPTPAGDYKASFISQNPLGSDDKSICTFHITTRSATWTFQGKEDLGLLKGGTFTYTGTVDGQTFTCHYDSPFDKGTFQMQRPTPATSDPRP